MCKAGPLSLLQQLSSSVQCWTQPACVAPLSRPLRTAVGSPPSCTSLLPTPTTLAQSRVCPLQYCSTTGLDYSGIQPQKQVTSTPNPLAAAAAAAGATPGPGRLAGATPGTAMVGGTPGRAIAGVASTPGGLAAALGATPGVLWVVRWTTHRGASLEQQSAKHTLRI